MELVELNKMCEKSLISHLGIIFTATGDDYLEAEMPVNEFTMQPMKILHGGAYLALAETVGSALSYLHIDRNIFEIKGLDIYANHLKSVSEAYVTARAEFVKKGEKNHVVQILIHDDSGETVCICHLTNIILEK